MKPAFCVVAGPLETCTRYEPSARCQVICAVSCAPWSDTVQSGRRSPARYTAGEPLKFAPVSVSVSPVTAAVLTTTCGGGFFPSFFPCASADDATERAHTRAPTNRATTETFRDMRHLHCSRMG